MYYENPSLRRSGEERLIAWHNTLLRNPDGKITGILSFGTDITERKQMEHELMRDFGRLEGMVAERTKQLSESEEKLTSILESSPDAIVVIAPDGKINECNHATLVLLKVPTKEELIGKSFLDFVTQKDHKLALEGMAALQTQGYAKDIDFTILSKNGREVPVSMSASYLQAKSGKLGDIVAIVKDMTQHKAEEAELKKAMKLKEQFISHITHELRTPLVSIAGYLDYIMADNMGPVPESIKGGLAVARRNTERLVQLTNDLLDVRRIEAGKIQLVPELLDLREILDQCIKEITPFFYKKKQILKLKIQERPLRVQGDRIRLNQIVMNLLSNASKFTPEEGQITIQAEEDADTITVQVSDTGIGIRKEDLKRVFKPFAAISKPSYDKGTGLGLSVTKGLVEAHGGKIWAESPGEGKGATFIFILPKKVRGGEKEERGGERGEGDR